MNITLLNKAINEALKLKVRNPSHSMTVEQAYAKVAPLKAWQQASADEQAAGWDRALSAFDAFMNFTQYSSYPAQAAEQGSKHILELAITCLNKNIDKGFFLQIAAKRGQKAIVELLLSYPDTLINLSILLPTLTFGHDEIACLLIADPRAQAHPRLLEQLLRSNYQQATPLLLDRLKTQKVDITIALNASIIQVFSQPKHWALPLLLKHKTDLHLSGFLPSLIEVKSYSHENWKILLSHPSIDLTLLSAAVVFLKASLGDVEASIRLADLEGTETTSKNKRYNELSEKRYRLKHLIIPTFREKLISEFYEAACFAGEDRRDSLKEILKETSLDLYDLRSHALDQIKSRLKTISTLEEKIVFLMDQEVQFMSSTRYPLLCSLLGKEKDNLVTTIHALRLDLDKQRNIPSPPTEVPVTPAARPPQQSQNTVRSNIHRGHTGVFSVVNRK